MQKNLPAYTLVEAVIYVFALGTIVTVVTGLILMIYRYKTVVEDRVTVSDNLRTLVKSIQDDMYLGIGITVVDANRMVIQLPSSGGQITYFLQGSQVYRQSNSDTAVVITSDLVDVISFNITDISSADSAGTIRITFDLSNFPTGTLKPEVRETVTTTMSLKFI